MSFRPAAFVFHRDGAPRAIRHPVQFDDIGYSRDAQPVGAQRHSRNGPNASSYFGLNGMNALMQDAALGGCGVLRPALLHMDQSALARTEQVVLQSGEGN